MKTGSEEILRAISRLEPDLAAYLPGFPMNEVVRGLEEGQVDAGMILPVASEFDAVGAVIGVSQAGGYGVAVLKDKGAYVAAQLLAEEGDHPGLLLIGLDADGRGSYTCSVELPEVLKEWKLGVHVPSSVNEIVGTVEKAAEASVEEHRIHCVVLTEDILLTTGRPGSFNPEGCEPSEGDWEELERALDAYDDVVIVIGKGVLGDVSEDLPAVTSSTGHQLDRVWELKGLLEGMGLNVRMVCTKHASKFLPGVPSSGINVGREAKADLVFLVGASYDVFAATPDADFVVSVNPDPDAYAHSVADVSFEVTVSEFVEALRERLER